MSEFMNNETNNNIAALLKRVFLFLEDGDWKSANTYCERVLDIDPECVEAYVGKLMAETKSRKKEDLKHSKKLLEKSNNYVKILNFADEKTVEEIKEYNEATRKGKKKKQILISAFLSFVALLVAFSILLVTVIIPKVKFKDIVAVSAGTTNTVGLKSDGTVVAVGSNTYGECNVSDWTDIVAISAGFLYTVGLKSDGTVVAVGRNGFDEFNVSDLTDIVAISAGVGYIVGLKSDGTVVTAGKVPYIRSEYEIQQTILGSDWSPLRRWTDIVAISAGSRHTVGLKEDGTVVAVGYNDDGQCNVEEWTDIVAISAGEHHTVGLKSDGTVVAVGSNTYGECNVSDWTDIVAISAGKNYTAGLKSDGTVAAVGYNDDGQCNVEEWTDIVAISAGEHHTVGLKSDGTVVAVGWNGSGRCLVGGKK